MYLWHVWIQKIFPGGVNLQTRVGPASDQGGLTNFIIAKRNFLENEVDCHVSKVKFDIFQASAPKCVQEKDYH